MTKTEAAFELMRQGQLASRVTTASATRVVKACKALGMDHAETLAVVRWLDICDQDGEPYSPRVKRVW